MAYYRNKRKINPKLRLVLTFLVVLCLGVGIGLMFTPVFHVQEVYCEGNSRITAEEITATAQGATGKNIFLVRLSELRKQVEDIPMVEEAFIRRVFPNKIKIRIVECIPVGYIHTDNQLVVTDIKGKVLDILTGEQVTQLQEAYTPKEISNKNEKSETPQASGEPTKESTDESPAQDTETTTEEPSEIRSYSVPLVMGLTLHKPAIGKKAESKENEKFTKAFELFRHLENNGLLVRATYLDLTDITDITLVLENRLEIQLGKPENLEYRCAFLAKVINERISATESAVLDYRSADIYVRQPEDGKERMKPTATPTPTPSATNHFGTQETPKETTSPTPTPAPSTITTLSEG